MCPESEQRPSLATGAPDDRVDDVSIVARSAAGGSEVAPARARADRIKLLIDRMSDDRDQVLSLVTEAYEVRDWRALGYPSWRAYVTEEFGTALHRLGRDDQRDVVLLLNHTGMSTRAIAPVLGIGKSTVGRDASGVPDGTPDVVGHDDEGEVHDDRRLDQAHAEIGRVTSTVPAVTGVDGKIYIRNQVPPPQRRTRFPDSYRDATYRLEKDVRRLSNLHDDDRWARAVATGSLTRFVNDIRRARDELDRLLEQVDTEPAQREVAGR